MSAVLFFLRFIAVAGLILAGAHYYLWRHLPYAYTFHIAWLGYLWLGMLPLFFTFFICADALRILGWMGFRLPSAPLRQLGSTGTQPVFAADHSLCSTGA